MRWLADENIHLPIIDALRSAGEDVVTVAGLALSGDDSHVVRLAADHDRLLLTEDKDFGELVVRRRMPLPGVILLRLHGLPLAERGAILVRAISAHGERFRGSFTVVHHERIRIRPLERGPAMPGGRGAS